jgi:hypothetical protein
MATSIYQFWSLHISLHSYIKSYFNCTIHTTKEYTILLRLIRHICKIYKIVDFFSPLSKLHIHCWKRSKSCNQYKCEANYIVQTGTLNLITQLGKLHHLCTNIIQSSHPFPSYSPSSYALLLQPHKNLTSIDIRNKAHCFAFYSSIEQSTPSLLSTPSLHQYESHN